jgi:hypothetical protein
MSAICIYVQKSCCGVIHKKRKIHLLHSQNQIFSGRILSLSLSFLSLPLRSTGHPWNALFHFSVLILHTVGRTPWTGDQPVAKAVIYTEQHKHRITADIHVLSGIGTQDPSVLASEDISCVGPRGHCHRRWMNQWTKTSVAKFINRKIWRDYAKDKLMCGDCADEEEDWLHQ